MEKYLTVLARKPSHPGEILREEFDAIQALSA